MRTSTSCETNASRCDCPPRSECPPRSVAFPTAVMVRAETGGLALGASTDIGTNGMHVVLNPPVPFTRGTDVEISFPVPHRERPVEATGRIVAVDEQDSAGRCRIEVTFDAAHPRPLEAIEPLLAEQCCA